MTKQNNRKKGEVKMLLGLTGTAAALAGGALVSTNVAHADTVDQPNQPVVQQTATDPAQTAKDNLQTAQTKADQATQAQTEAQTAYDHAQGQLNQAHQAVANDQQAVQKAQDQVNQASDAVQSAQAGGPTVTSDQVNQASQAVAQAQQAANQAQQQADQAATAVTRAQQAVDQAQAGNKNTAAQASQAAQDYLQAQIKAHDAETAFANNSSNVHSWTPSQDLADQQNLAYLQQLYAQSIKDHGQLNLPGNLPSSLDQILSEYRDAMASRALDQAQVLHAHHLGDQAALAYDQATKLNNDYIEYNDNHALNDGQWDPAALANSFYPGLSKLDAWKYYANQFGGDTDPNLEVPAQYKDLNDYFNHNLTPWSKSLTWHSTAKDQQELLPEIAVKHADGFVTYDLSKLTDQHLIELNRFGMDVLNQIRLHLPGGGFVGFNTAILNAAKHAAQVYTQDNWHYLDKGDHDIHALADKDNMWAYGENLDARRDNFPIKSMDDLKHALWLNLREGLFNDGTSDWGHTGNFLGAGLAAFAFDNVTPQSWWQNWVRSGQMHFLTGGNPFDFDNNSTNLYHLDANDSFKRSSHPTGGVNGSSQLNYDKQTQYEHAKLDQKLTDNLTKAGLSNAQQAQIKQALVQLGISDEVEVYQDAVKQDARDRKQAIDADPTGYQKIQQALKDLETARNKYAATPGVPEYIVDGWLNDPIKTNPVTTNSSLAKAQADLTQAQANKAKADQALKDAQKQLADRQAKLKDLQQRAKTLPEAQADYAKAQKALADAQKQLDADQQALQTAQTNQAKAKQVLATAQQAYQTAQNELATARQAYAKTQGHDNLNNQVAHQAEQLNRNDHRTGNTSAQAGASMTVSVVNGASHVAAAAGKVAQAEVNHLTATAQQAAGAVKDAKLPQTGAAQASSNWAVLGLASLLGFIGFGGRRKFRA